jgi:hypothetical protein
MTKEWRYTSCRDGSDLWEIVLHSRPSPAVSLSIEKDPMALGHRIVVRDYALRVVGATMLSEIFNGGLGQMVFSHLKKCKIDSVAGIVDMFDDIKAKAAAMIAPVKTMAKVARTKTKVKSKPVQANAAKSNPSAVELAHTINTHKQEENTKRYNWVHHIDDAGSSHWQVRDVVYTPAVSIAIDGGKSDNANWHPSLISIVFSFLQNINVIDMKKIRFGAALHENICDALASKGYDFHNVESLDGLLLSIENMVGEIVNGFLGAPQKVRVEDGADAITVITESCNKRFVENQKMQNEKTITSAHKYTWQYCPKTREDNDYWKILSKDTPILSLSIYNNEAIEIAHWGGKQISLITFNDDLINDIYMSIRHTGVCPPMDINNFDSLTKDIEKKASEIFKANAKKKHKYYWEYYNVPAPEVSYWRIYNEDNHDGLVDISLDEKLKCISIKFIRSKMVRTVNFDQDIAYYIRHIIDGQIGINFSDIQMSKALLTQITSFVQIVAPEMTNAKKTTDNFAEVIRDKMEKDPVLKAGVLAEQSEADKETAIYNETEKIIGRVLDAVGMRIFLDALNNSCRIRLEKFQEAGYDVGGYYKRGEAIVSLIGEVSDEIDDFEFPKLNKNSPPAVVLAVVPPEITQENKYLYEWNRIAKPNGIPHWRVSDKKMRWTRFLITLEKDCVVVQRSDYEVSAFAYFNKGCPKPSICDSIDHTKICKSSEIENLQELLGDIHKEVALIIGKKKMSESKIPEEKPNGVA